MVFSISKCSHLRQLPRDLSITTGYLVFIGRSQGMTYLSKCKRLFYVKVAPVLDFFARSPLNINEA